jgi:environmental stress-induced protein Ves
MPWANGGGVTREVAAEPPGAGWDGFDWRVSLADVTRDGPYSPLPGVERILTVVEGAGLELTIDGKRHVLNGRHEPLAFAGAAATGCRLLDGPVVNLNVMLRQGRSAATVEMAGGRHPVAPGRTGPVLTRSGVRGRAAGVGCHRSGRGGGGGGGSGQALAGPPSSSTVNRA